MEAKLETKTNLEAYMEANLEAYVETNLETYARHSATTTILEAKLEAWMETKSKVSFLLYYAGFICLT